MCRCFHPSGGLRRSRPIVRSSDPSIHLPASDLQFSDWLIGDNVLRNVYAVYDFGDFDTDGKMGNPFVKLLPLTDPNQASADFAKIRGSQPRTNITYNVASPDVVGTASSSVSATQDALDKLNNLIPIILGVMGLNALVLLTLTILVIVYFCRRGRSRAARRVRGQSALPMPMNSVSSVEAGEPTHRYEPVMNVDQLPQSPSVHSLHSTHSTSPRPTSNTYPQSLGGIPGGIGDDPFRTPPPSLQKNFGGLVNGMRPHSYHPVGTGASQINTHPPRSAPADEESFVPPSPGFFRRDFPSGPGDNLGPGSVDGLRPNSIA